MASQIDKTQYLHGIVDMGSNGVRFSITDLSPPTARIMPTLYQDRASISLYDAQYPSSSSSSASSTTTTTTTTKSPIPPSTIADVLSAMRRFQRTCADFRVSPSQIRVLATEATREAVNSVEFRDQIRQATGWTVEMLTKEEEGRVGAMGVASSYRSVDGLVMDLGGGSTQMTWLTMVDGEVTVGEGGSVSLPYGAAALLRRLEEAERQGPAEVDALTKEVESRLLAAFETVAPPRRRTSPFPLFLSGGGFRGWGYVLLHNSPISPYPIPIINGFSAPTSSFTSTTTVTASVSSESSSIFRVAARRASQIPAVAFLVSALTRAVGAQNIERVRFCQGGVREGALFASLPRSVRSQAPISVATTPHAPPSADKILALLRSGGGETPQTPQLIKDLLPALSNLLYAFLPETKETRAAVALRCTSTGLLAGVHGLSHEERACLALMLCERWGGRGELAPTDEGFYDRVVAVVGPETAWWAGFSGKVAAVVGEAYPAGRVGAGGARGVDATESPRLQIHTHPTSNLTNAISLEFKLPNHDSASSLEKPIHDVSKCGKRKNWVGGREGWGLKVEVAVSVVG